MNSFYVRIWRFVLARICHDGKGLIRGLFECLRSASELICKMVVAAYLMLEFILSVILSPVAIPIKAIKRRRDDHRSFEEIKGVIERRGPLPKHTRSILDRAVYLFPNDEVYREILRLDDAAIQKRQKDINEPDWHK